MTDDKNDPELPIGVGPWGDGGHGMAYAVRRRSTPDREIGCNSRASAEAIKRQMEAAGIGDAEIIEY